MCEKCRQIGADAMSIPPRTCCPQPRVCSESTSAGGAGVSRRGFLGGVGGATLGSVALSGLSWAALAAQQPELPSSPGRRALVVKPLLLYRTYTPRPQRSWRAWGGIHSDQAAQKEAARIRGELEKLRAEADFPLEFLPLAVLKNESGLASDPEVKKADVLLVYAADGNLNAIAALKKDTIFFVRHRSGPVYLHYEIISPRFLRQHTDHLKVEGMDFSDVVVDSQEGILWRLRALCGLRNTVGMKILAIGGPGGWAQPKGVIEQLVREKWKLDIRTVTYEDLGKLIQEARKNKAEVALARERTEAYLKIPQTSLETERKFVENAFLLEQIFRRLMVKAGCRAITINGCMGTIMPLAQTSACLALSTLNDDGWLAFCESDFVVIPACMLLAQTAGKPMFFNDPTYPHDGLITLAHCTGPRKLDGRTAEPVRLLTHFESDYGAAPKVEMQIGQVVTIIAPDFAEQRWMGLLGEIAAHPFLPICRCQVDVRYKVPDQLVAERMPGFHWVAVYGDYHREIGYALRRIPIQWDFLG